MILFLVEVKLYGQVTVAIESVLVNNQTTVTNCNTIDFGTVSSNSLNFSFKLTKPLNQVVGNGPIKIMFKYSSASTGNQRNSITILSGSWNDDTFNNISTYQSSIQTNISASEIQVSGSSVYLQYTSSGGINYDSTCEYPLIKTPPPSFTLIPTSVSLSCGDTSSRTFTVTPANIPSGATVTYQWSYTGWSLISSTATSITLQPNSGTSLPSNVSVTPFINGVAQTQKTCVVSRAPFSPSATLVGSDILCSTGTYTINNMPSNSSVTWSSSNIYVATITPINSTQATLSKTGSGIVTVTATVINACGQQKTFTKNVTVGSANVDYVVFTNGVGGTDYFCTSHTGNAYEILPHISGATHQFRLRQYPNLNIVYTSNTITGNTGTVNYYPSPGWYVFEVARTNSCGTTDWFGTEVEFVDCSQQGGGGEMEFRISPNPTSETLTISKKQTKEDKNTPKPEADDSSSYKLYDFNANLVDQGIFINETIIDVSGYKKGKYILKIDSLKTSKTYQIVVE
ncbi:T9SS type A sorting domain-containing protein [Geojedonia litorea]|uniref:T9SS type A sorting domain-containing protein n=1 Tax=Geojedonia litorea TaxID=1268269 RepID=A0ABV9N5A2_9FLAO